MTQTGIESVNATRYVPPCFGKDLDALKNLEQEWLLSVPCTVMRFPGVCKPDRVCKLTEAISPRLYMLIAKTELGKGEQ